MVALLKTLQLILALSLLIFIHELGHFFWAKIFGIRVDKFYLFFDVKGFALCRWKWGDTEFGIGWLPLGGYCKIAGMVDESLDMEQLKQDPQPWEFRSHPAWQRLLVMAGGVLNNFIFALIAFCVIMGIWGSSYIPNKGNKIYTNSLSEQMGFRTGDEILRLDDYEPDDFYSLQADLARRSVREVLVLRGRDSVKLYVDQSLIGQVMNTPGMFSLALPFVIDSLDASSPNVSLRRGDRIIGIDGTPTEYFQDARPLLLSASGRQVEAEVLRDGDTLSMPLQVDSTGMLKVYTQLPHVETRKYSALEAIPAGIEFTGETIGSYLRDLRLLANPGTGAYKSVGSFIAIGQVMPSSWNWQQFIFILALLSIMLAVMNLLPIPGLDGGHIVFTLYEMITGRKPSERFLYITQLIGMVLLLMLMILAFRNDITRLLH